MTRAPFVEALLALTLVGLRTELSAQALAEREVAAARAASRPVE